MIRALSFHAGYACRRSGACCSSGWAIPVETSLHPRLTRALAEGRLAVAHPPARVFASSADLPTGFAAVLGQDEAGRCLFHDDQGTCAIQRQLGPGWLPAACRHFPRVVLIDDRGVSVSLSHYCPTAARLLLRDDEVAIVEDPPVYPLDGDYEGLDARGALPPLLKPGVLMDLASFDLWERHAVAVLASPGLSPEGALARLSADAEAIRAWRHADGPLADHVRGVTSKRARSGRGEATLDRIVGRYLAAKAFGSWVAYQGRGLRTFVRSLEAALTVVRAEAARAADLAGRDLDEALLVEAIRAADLRLVHLADREALARTWSAADRDP